MRFETQKTHSKSARRVIRGARSNMLALWATNRPRQAEMACWARWGSPRFRWDSHGTGTQRMQHEGRAERDEDGGEGEQG
jgi:hypothetical protein